MYVLKIGLDRMPMRSARGPGREMRAEERVTGESRFVGLSMRTEHS
jgi:hypothetical protein